METYEDRRMKHVSAVIPLEDWRRLVDVKATRDCTIGALVREAVQDFLATKRERVA